MTDSVEVRNADDTAERLHRLESALAALADTHLNEERVAERVAQRLKPSAMQSLRNSAGVILDASRALMPVATLDPSGERTTAPTAENPVWMVFGLWNEVRTFIRMLGDHRYPFTLIGRFGPVVIACTYFFGWMFIGSMAIIGGFTERVIDVFLAVLLYKIMSREVTRYRLMFPNPRSG